MELIVASNNEGKIREFRDKLIGLDLELLSIKEAVGDLEIEEDGTNYEENALIKARKLHSLTGKMCIGDDSGLEIEAMPGELGIHTARFLGANTSYEKKIEEVLRRLKDVPFEKRKAKFKCALGVCLPSGEEKIFVGECHGYIHDRSAGTGFGYDPVFYLPEYKKTFGELGIGIKNRLSHRGLALGKFKEYLQNEYNS